jgi:Holliday junction resolvasome RuvABC endonuclease subunit
VDVLGLDLSLAATGLACGEHGSERLNTPASEVSGMPRLQVIRDAVLAHAPFAAVVVVENYAYSRGDAHAHALGELGGVVRLALFEAGIPYVDVGPSSLKKWATGKGNAGKDEMLAAAIRRFGFEGYDNNEADAWLLRAMGLAFYERSEVPAYQAEAMAKVAWPVIDGGG